MLASKMLKPTRQLSNIIVYIVQNKKNNGHKRSAAYVPQLM